MSADHPKVRAARQTEEEISRSLREELAVAQHGVEIDLRLCADRRGLLEDQLAKTNRRLENLAEVRAEYANQTADVKNRAVLLERAEGNLAEARAARASAKATSLISRIDMPDAGIRPVGPGRLTIALGGIVGGLLAGFGLVFLAVPVSAPNRTTSTLLVAVGAGRRVASGYSEVNASAKPRIGAGSGSLGRFTVKHALQTLAN